MSAQMLDALAELELRAGASDADRPAWLAQRRAGITATEVRDLVLGNPGTKARLIEKKLSGLDEPELRAAVIRWGREREAVLAGLVENVHGLAPESRVFHAADNPRYLASPDGLGLGWDGALEVSEIKTSGADISPVAPAYAKKGYLLQKVWSMRVTGARRCLYVWEPRIDDGAGWFVPGEVRMEWVEYDEQIARMLEAVAVDFLDSLDAAAAGEPVVDDELDTLAVNVLRFREMEAAAVAAKAEPWDEMYRILRERGEPLAQKSLLAQVTYTPETSTTSEVLDEDAARVLDPFDLWGDVAHAEAELKAARERWAAHAKEFTKTVTVTKRDRLTVTPAAATRKEKGL